MNLITLDMYHKSMNPIKTSQTVLNELKNEGTNVLPLLLCFWETHVSEKSTFEGIERTLTLKVKKKMLVIFDKNNKNKISERNALPATEDEYNVDNKIGKDMAIENEENVNVSEDLKSHEGSLMEIEGDCLYTLK